MSHQTQVNTPFYKQTNSRYPMITPWPTVGMLFSNMRASDMGLVAGATAVSFPLGAILGRPARRSAMWFFGVTGFSAMTIHVMQRVTWRLQGKMENYKECITYGIYPRENEQ
eukprot:TRINITY_DN3960_c0_g1_i1.p1 TRINITY_DN3960_c0_g1~~TRINITY_DN3960_c0_g1_i1.p1  ORF type:complete len:112 (-),score=8.70 TRINITY_DN3960_c0_g1_i1:21-356(-)